MRVLSAPTGVVFTATLDLYSFSLTAAGPYKFSLRSFIHCAYDGCENANDYILIRASENGQFRDLYRMNSTSGRIKDEKWVLDEFYFTVINYITFYVNI